MAKTLDQYRADLFREAAEFKTADATRLTQINELIEAAAGLNGLKPKFNRRHSKFDDLVVFSVAAKLRSDQLSQVNSKGYSSVRAGSESVTFYSATGTEGNKYQAELERLRKFPNLATFGGQR